MQHIRFSLLRKAVRKLRRKAVRSYRHHIALYLKDRSLRRVERFVFSWVAVFVLGGGVILYQINHLGAYYLTQGPQSGGQFTEGVVGDISGLNPIFSGNRATRTAEALLFRSLFTYNGQGEIVPDLAREYTLNDTGTVYTVSMDPDARWHDGKPVTAQDVVFTFRAIQNPDTGSSLQVAWQDIQMKALDDSTVRFTLPNPYVPFLTQLTTGIVPRHHLEEVDMDRLRVANFNQAPVGSGPFMFDKIGDGRKVHMEANPEYPEGEPRLDRFTVTAFADRYRMVQAYNRGELSSMIAGSELDTNSVRRREQTDIRRIDIPGQVFTFFNTQRLSDTRLRRGLVRGIDQNQIVKRLPGTPKTADSPLLPEHPGYMPAQLSSNPGKADQLLNRSGWKRTEDGVRQRNGEDLSIEIVTRDTPQYVTAAETVARQWRDLGVSAEVRAVGNSKLQQDIIRPRDYDVLLFGVSVGVDPDVYAYWHSSQTEDTGRNLSVYTSSLVDDSLEDGRTRSDTRLRAAKYKTFQEEWRSDAPAAALYRLHDYYVEREEARGIKVDNIVRSIDRFYNVEEWTIRTQPVLRRLQE